MDTTNAHEDIDWGRTETFSDIKFHDSNNNSNSNRNNSNDVESKWSMMDEELDEELEESNFNWCICFSRSFAIVLLVIIAVLMSLHKFFPRIYWLAAFITAFLIFLILLSFCPLKYLKSHVISTYSLTNGLKEIIIGSNTNTNTPTNSNTNSTSDISITEMNSPKTTLKTKLLPISKTTSNM